jgi:hypothetical protein
MFGEIPKRIPNVSGGPALCGKHRCSMKFQYFHGQTSAPLTKPFMHNRGINTN